MTGTARKPQFVAALGEAEKFGVQDPRLSSTLGKLADAHFALRKYPQTEAVCRRQIAIDMGRLGSTNVAVAFELIKLAQAEESLKKYPDAERHFLRAQEIVAKTRGASSPLIGIYLSKRANLLLLQGKQDEAEALYARALNFVEDTQFDLSFVEGASGEQNFLIGETVRIRNEYAALCEQRGKLVDAEKLLARAVTSLEQLSNTNSVQLPPVLNNLARIQAKQSEFSDAEATVRRSLEIVEETKALESMAKETRQLQAAIVARRVK